MQKARYNYRIEINRWTWLGGASAAIFLGLLLVPILSRAPILVTTTYTANSQDDVMIPALGTYDPIEGTVTSHVIPMEDLETPYDVIVPSWVVENAEWPTTNTLESEDAMAWFPPDRIVAEPLEHLVLAPASAALETEAMPIEEVEEAANATKTLVERVLELISQILDKLVQLITGAITLMGIWKSFKRVERKDEE